jgi:hypothetical protein
MMARFTENVTYVGHKEFNKDKELRTKRGWRVASVTEVQQPAGLKRVAAIGFGALVIKPKPHFFVVYEKD